MIPGLGGQLGDMDIDDKDLNRIEALIQSMTPTERARPQILNTSRRDRIAKGAGASRMDLDDLLKQFSGMKKMMDSMTRAGGKGPSARSKR